MSRLPKTIKNFFRLLGKIIFPKTCFICNQIIADGFLCVKDWNQIRFLHKPACAVCFQPFEFKIDDEMICAACIKKRPTYFKAISVIKYDQFSRKLITKFKYNDQTYVNKYFSELMYKNAKEILDNIDFIVPIPLHKLRLISRKYNQSALIAKNLGKISNLSVIVDLLIRIKNTKPQKGLSKKMRQKNISGAFIINKKYQNQISGKNILLIDDVITSGATIEACAKVLMKAKVNRVYVLTLAKRVRE